MIDLAPALLPQAGGLTIEQAELLIKKPGYDATIGYLHDDKNPDAMTLCKTMRLIKCYAEKNLYVQNSNGERSLFDSDESYDPYDMLLGTHVFYKYAEPVPLGMITNLEKDEITKAVKGFYDKYKHDPRYRTVTKFAEVLVNQLERGLDRADS